MKRLIPARRTPRPPQRRMTVDFYDRHAEHIDPDLPLCDHRSYKLEIGDTLNGIVEMDIQASLVLTGVIEAKAEFSIELVEPNRIRVVVNMPDYLAARRVALDKRP